MYEFSYKFKNYVMKRFLFLFMLHLSISAFCSAEEFTTLVVWAKDGSKVAYLLENKPVLTFEEGNLVIKTKDITIHYVLKQMQRFTFENGQNVANTDLSSKEDIPFVMNTEYILFPSLEKGASILIYTVQGQVVVKKTMVQAGDVSVPISQLQSGIYFVQVNGITYKIMKK